MAFAGFRASQRGVKPLAWNGSDRYVAVLARYRDTSNHYFAALRSSNRLELCRVNPSPASAANGVSRDVVLSWLPGANATSHDVAFGTESTPPFVVNQTASCFDPPGSLLANTKYYWRISERNAAGSALGAIWNFTTAGRLQTLFSDNFESGSLSSWSLLSDTWAIITDGSKV